MIKVRHLANVEREVGCKRYQQGNQNGRQSYRNLEAEDRMILKCIVIYQNARLLSGLNVHLILFNGGLL
jgi:hypothetical protein